MQLFLFTLLLLMQCQTSFAKPSTPTTNHCNALDYTNCTSCVQVGCYWCKPHGKCENTTTLEPPWNKIEALDPTAWIASEDECHAGSSSFSDPLYDSQRWVFDVLNVTKAWDDFKLNGSGIKIQIVDDGVDADHQEFTGRFSEADSCELSQPIDGNQSHGTSVASIAAAGGNNGLCAVGVAPLASISSCRLLGPENTTVDPTTAFDRASDAGVDISVNSWGVDACPRKWDNSELQNQVNLTTVNEIEVSTTGVASDCPVYVKDESPLRLDDDNCSQLLQYFCVRKNKYESELESESVTCRENAYLYTRCNYTAAEIPPETRTALKRGVEKGRHGKGVIFVFAAGNDYQYGETINMEGYLNTRYTITVGAVDKASKHSSYSTIGTAALFISGPGGDKEYFTNHMTAALGGGCKSARFGTSFAAPAVSGAIALLLEGRPELGWRDVQGILAKTSRKPSVDPLDPYDWTTNAAGFSHHPMYGFGIMDTYSAVVEAKEWELWEAERSETQSSGDIDETIPNNSTPVVSTIFAGGEFLFTESVMVKLHLKHPSRGGLEISLKSPNGTIAVLLSDYHHETKDDASWELMSLLSWGEDPKGEWTLNVVSKVCRPTPEPSVSTSWSPSASSKPSTLPTPLSSAASPIPTEELSTPWLSQVPTSTVPTPLISTGSPTQVQTASQAPTSHSSTVGSWTHVSTTSPPPTSTESPTEVLLLSPSSTSTGSPMEVLAASPTPTPHPFANGGSNTSMASVGDPAPSFPSQEPTPSDSPSNFVPMIVNESPLDLPCCMKTGEPIGGDYCKSIDKHMGEYCCKFCEVSGNIIFGHGPRLLQGIHLRGGKVETMYSTGTTTRRMEEVKKPMLVSWEITVYGH